MNNSNFLSRLIIVLKRDGIAFCIVRAIAKLLRVNIAIHQVKEMVWSMLVKKYDYSVAYGPFKGMKLGKAVWWSEYDRIPQTFGIYEEHVMRRLISFAKKDSSVFIDIGAADGYFAVGVAFSGLYENVYAFEIDKKGQSCILENALSNNCQGKINVFGEANASSLAKILAQDSVATVLIDIEGAEYELLSTRVLSLLKNSNIVCELHPWMINNGIEEQRRLVQRASELFNIVLEKRESYSPNAFEELDHLRDEERLIVVGEGRRKNMEWMVLTPKY